MKLTSVYFGAFLTLSALNACSSSPASSSGFVVDAVNEYVFDFVEGQPGAVISFHSSELQKCSLSFAAKSFTAGFKATATKLGEGTLDIVCLNDKGNFILSPSLPTSVSMEILSAEPLARVRVDFNLYNPRGKTWQKVENVQLELNRQQTQALKP